MIIFETIMLEVFYLQFVFTSQHGGWFTLYNFDNSKWRVYELYESTWITGRINMCVLVKYNVY